MIAQYRYDRTSSGPLYAMLTELAQAPPLESGKARMRVLFLVPESDGSEARGLLEAQRLPYAVKPFHFHDFLEKVSDLLMETEPSPSRFAAVRLEPGRRAPPRARHSARMRRPARRQVNRRRNTGMFANRDYYEMTEEEIADYERQEAEEQRKKKKKAENSGHLVPADVSRRSGSCDRTSARLSR